MTLHGEESREYNASYFAGYRKATIDHLGGKCVDCDETDPYKLEIHHVNGLERKARHLSDWKNLAELELKCKTHHNHNGEAQ
jgi:hypothetical protein